MKDSRKKIVLIAQDRESFTVDFEIASISTTLRSIINEFSFQEKTIRIPLYNINSRTLVKIIEYCRYHAELCKKKICLNTDSLHLNEKTIQENNWKISFFDVNDQALFNLSIAAAFLEINELLEFSTKMIAENLSKKGMLLSKNRLDINSVFLQN
mmetsp:Transcript_56170/g.114873  ORF Transcript_56170/g.114873 Transcript_56170/m.114873 type:complete len:155 (+) Transcript_56170:302-766(+)